MDLASKLIQSGLQLKSFYTGDKSPSVSIESGDIVKISDGVTTLKIQVSPKDPSLILINFKVLGLLFDTLEYSGEIAVIEPPIASLESHINSNFQALGGDLSGTTMYSQALANGMVWLDLLLRIVVHNSRIYKPSPNVHELIARLQQAQKLVLEQNDEFFGIAVKVTETINELGYELIVSLTWARPLTQGASLLAIANWGWMDWQQLAKALLNALKEQPLDAPTSVQQGFEQIFVTIPTINPQEGQ